MVSGAITVFGHHSIFSKHKKFYGVKCELAVKSLQNNAGPAFLVTTQYRSLHSTVDYIQYLPVTKQY